MLERSMQAQFLIPMAVSLAFGVLFATFITLVLVPSGYMSSRTSRPCLRGCAGRNSRPPTTVKGYSPGPR